MPSGFYDSAGCNKRSGQPEPEGPIGDHGLRKGTACCTGHCQCRAGLGSSTCLGTGRGANQSSQLGPQTDSNQTLYPSVRGSLCELCLQVMACPWPTDRFRRRVAIQLSISGSVRTFNGLHYHDPKPHTHAQMHFPSQGKVKQVACELRGLFGVHALCTQALSLAGGRHSPPSSPPDSPSCSQALRTGSDNGLAVTSLPYIRRVLRQRVPHAAGRWWRFATLRKTSGFRAFQKCRR